MALYARFYTTDEAAFSVATLATTVATIDPPYRLDPDGNDPNSADLHRGDELLGELEISRKGDGTFEDERGEVLERFEGLAENNPGRQGLEAATGAIVLRVLYQARSVERTFELLDPFWDWCFVTYGGVLQVDDDGLHGLEDQWAEEG